MAGTRRSHAILSGLAALTGAAAAFVMSTVASDRLPDAVTAAAAPLLALLLVVPFAEIPTRDAIADLRRRPLVLAALGGVAAFWGAPLIVLSWRFTDAPPGAEVLFFTTSAWGLLALLAATVVPAERPSPSALAGAFAALAGGAALLANWERPSSFSPFVRYLVPDLAFLAAGALFACGALALAAGARELGARTATLAGLASAAAVGTVASLPVLPSALASLALDWPVLLALGVATAAFAAGWVRTAEAAGTATAAVALLGAPAAVTALTLAERATGRLGVDPVVWGGAFAGMAAIAAGCGAVIAAGGRRAVTAAGAPTPPRAALPAALAALGAAVATLALPALSASAEGHAAQQFSANWMMLGAEAAAPWLAVGAALLVTAAALDARRGQARSRWVAALVGALVCAATTWPLLGTPLRTWTAWIPASVQQAYGTEYARFEVSAATSPVLWVSLALTLVAAGILGYHALRGNAAGQKEIA